MYGQELYLWRVSLKQGAAWEKRKKPIYVVTATKQEAEKYVVKHLKKGNEISQISKLARRCAGSMFAG